MDRFFRAATDIGKARRADVVEKDYYLHQLLMEISHDPYLRDNLVFKGGTCLVKAYSGYYRFSEDIDFTWADQTGWSQATTSRRNDLCAKECEEIIRHVKIIADRMGLSFSGSKNGDDVHISSGGKMLTLRPTYYSALGRMRSEVKLEFNLHDLVLFPFRDRKLGTYIEGDGFGSLESLFEEPFHIYTSSVELTCYDSREIFIEKCRALMTRKVYKPRDSLDLYHMGKTMGFTVRDHEEGIVRKVGFSLDTYERYLDNIEDNDLSKLRYDRRDENLLLREMPDDLEASIVDMHRELESIRAGIVTATRR